MNVEYIPNGFKPNHRRADSIFAYLIGTYEDGDFPYTSATLTRRPQDQVPKELWANANFWFYLTHMMRGRLESHSAAANVVKLYKRRPDLFDPKLAAQLSEGEIHDQLEKEFGTLKKRQHHARAWHRNSELLLAWGGDIRNVYDGVTTEEEVRARIVNKRKYSLPPRERGFFCFQAKMCALLTYFLVGAGHIKRISMSPPMDFHHQRVMIGTGIIPLPVGRYYPKAIEQLADQVGRKYLDRNPGMNPVKFADLLFILSREGCFRAVTGTKVNWKDPKTVKKYQEGCGRCPIEHKCEKTADTKSYYRDDGKTRVIDIVPRPRAPKRLR